MARHLTAITEIQGGRFSRPGRALLLLLGLMALSGQVAALSLGELVVNSRPGKPLRASVPVTLKGDEHLAELQITLATAEEYLQAYLKRPDFLEGVQIGLLATGQSSGRIQLFGQQPWQGEEAVLILHARWPQGELSRRFRLVQVRTTDTDRENNGRPVRFVEVTENDTLDAIAMRLSEETNRSYFHMMYALFLANPKAFYRGNMNNLKHGARLRVPTGAELYRLKDAEVFRVIRQHYDEWLQQQQESPAKATTEAGAILSGMSDEQTSVLDLSGGPQALNQQLRQLGEENETLQQRNAELKQRLARIEKQMGEVAEQVLDYQPAATAEQPLEQAPVKPEVVEEPVAEEKPDAEEKPAAAEKVAPAEKSRPVAAEGLPGSILFLIMGLVMVSGVLIRRYTAAQQGGGT